MGNVLKRQARKRTSTENVFLDMEMRAARFRMKVANTSNEDKREGAVAISGWCSEIKSTKTQYKVEF